MLVKKASATKIELPRSMVKVPPSKCCEENWVVVVVKDAFPSKKNQSIGITLDPDKGDLSPSASEDLKQTVKLSGMYKRLLLGFGVPCGVLNKYCAEIKSSVGALQHAHLVVSSVKTSCVASIDDMLEKFLLIYSSNFCQPNALLLHRVLQTPLASFPRAKYLSLDTLETSVEHENFSARCTARFYCLGPPRCCQVMPSCSRWLDKSLPKCRVRTGNICVVLALAL